MISMHYVQRSFINMLSSAAGYAVTMLVNFITTPLLLRGLGESAYGLQSLMAVIIGYLTFMDMGLDLPVTKLLAEDHACNIVEVEKSRWIVFLKL